MDSEPLRRFVAAGLGVGWIPDRIRGSDDGAGTLGALLAIPLAVATQSLGVGVQVAVLAALCLVGWWASGSAAEGEDPGWIVIDEVAGAFLAMMTLSGWPLVIGWLVARIGDITKRFPLVARAEGLSGPTGIMADDLVAGVWGLAAGLVAVALIG
jgi:phosphatidylglycerophosphatase A